MTSTVNSGSRGLSRESSRSAERSQGCFEIERDKEIPLN